jgi:hypothetical protein
VSNIRNLDLPVKVGEATLSKEEVIDHQENHHTLKVVNAMMEINTMIEGVKSLNGTIGVIKTKDGTKGTRIGMGIE